MSTVSASDLRVAIASDTGLPIDAILVACTHTHSGPDTGVAERNAGKPRATSRGGSFRRYWLRGGRGLAKARTGAHWPGWRPRRKSGRNRRDSARGRSTAGLEVLRIAAPDGRLIAAAVSPLVLTAPCAATTTSRSRATGRARASRRDRGSDRERSRRSCSAPHADVDPRTRGRDGPGDSRPERRARRRGGARARPRGRGRRAREPPRAVREPGIRRDRRAQRAREAAAAPGRARARAISRPSSARRKREVAPTARARVESSCRE